jgi:hypothetical protein
MTNSIGFDQKFEKEWRKLEIGSHWVMVLFVLAALAGVFGRGPFSHRTHKTSDGRLAIDFEPLARWGTTTQLTVHLSSPKGGTADQSSARQQRDRRGARTAAGRSAAERNRGLWRRRRLQLCHSAGPQ